MCRWYHRNCVYTPGVVALHALIGGWSGVFTCRQDPYDRLPLPHGVQACAHTQTHAYAVAYTPISINVYADYSGLHVQLRQPNQHQSLPTLAESSWRDAHARGANELLPRTAFMIWTEDPFK